jgi:hypothetical protein
MKRTVLKCVILFTAAVSLAFMACPQPTNDNTGPGPVSISGSEWSDSLRPVTTLNFLVDTVTLGGETTGDTAENWYWGSLTNTTPAFDVVEDAAAITDIVDLVEDNWGTNITMPDAVIVVWTDYQNRKGLQLYYYRAGTGKSYERLVCWGIGNPHEFKRQ